MNFLAHYQLSGDHHLVQLGGWLGDFVKGREAFGSYPPDTVAGIQLHRAIDQWVDAQAEVNELKRLFPEQVRRFGGIAIDVLMDHQLSRHWSDYSDLPLELAEQQAYAVVLDYPGALPPRLLRFARRARDTCLFSSYRELDFVADVLVAIGRRFRRDNPLALMGPMLPPVAAALENLFPPLYQRARAFAGMRREQLLGATGTGSSEHSVR